MDATSGSGDEPGEHSEGIWLEDEGPTGGQTGKARRRTAVVAAVVICLAVVAVPVSLALSGSGGPGQQAGDKVVKGLGSAANASKVLSALSATTDSGTFDFTYRLTGQPGPTTATTQPCQIGEPIAGGTSSGQAVPDPTSGSPFTTTPCEPQSSSVAYPTVTGGGIINVNPTALVASAAVESGLDVVVRVSGTQFWLDIGGTDVGLAPSSAAADFQGQDVVAAADTVDETLDAREGPVAMMALASPSGYLNLYQSEFSSAEDLGPSTVSGTPVTVYQVKISPAQEAQVAGATTDEQTAITDALTLLGNQGYTGTTVKVSIDAEGYILQSDSTANFSDGGSAELDTTFSNFGCAGTILFPGQTGPSTPPAGCTSPVPPTTVPTTASTASTAPSASSSTTTGGSTPATVAAATTRPVSGSSGSTGTTAITGPSTSTTGATPSTTTTGGG
jgi:hypothetical protein